MADKGIQLGRLSFGQIFFTKGPGTSMWRVTGHGESVMVVRKIGYLTPNPKMWLYPHDSREDTLDKKTIVYLAPPD